MACKSDGAVQVKKIGDLRLRRPVTMQLSRAKGARLCDKCNGCILKGDSYLNVADYMAQSRYAGGGVFFCLDCIEYE